MFCTNCGAKLPDSAAFCTSCGNRVVPTLSPAPVSKFKSERAFSIVGGILLLILAIRSMSQLGIRLNNLRYFIEIFGLLEVLRFPLIIASYIFCAILLFRGKRNSLLVAPFIVALVLNIIEGVSVLLSPSSSLSFLYIITLTAQAVAIAAILLRNKINGNQIIIAIPAVLQLIASALSWVQTLYLNLRYDRLSFGVLYNLSDIALGSTISVAAVYCVCRWACQRTNE